MSGKNGRNGASGKGAAVQKAAKSRNNGSSNIRLMPRNDKYRNSRPQGNVVPSPDGTAAIQAAPRVRNKRTVWVRSGFDYPLFTIVLILLAFGLVMMFSASYATAFKETGDSMFYLKKQGLFAIFGLAAMILVSNVDYHLFNSKPIVFLLSGASLALMALVKVMGITGNGAERWLKIGDITFQPSEVLKFAVIVAFAYMVEKKYKEIKDLKKGFIPFVIALAVSCGAVLIQPHLSATIIIFAIGFAMLFVAGADIKHLVVFLVMAIIAALLGVMLLKQVGYNYFDARILSFTDPEADIQKDTFQTYQSLVTIGSGGVFGLGFGNSRQKYSFLPESQNDFIFPIICEELGFVGAALVLLLFCILVWRGFLICAKARDKFGMMLAFGITFQIGLQALLNIAVVTNAIPNTGISLPFFSYGGTALMMQLGEMGILLNISRKAALK